MIDWSELKTYENNKYRSFEELCYQIAKGLYREKGHFTSIDDSGGGDGVEFYLTLENGDEWGWQAKFYYPEKRLNSSRKQSIKKSIKKACEVHPRLKKWILCTPTNFTPRKGRSQGEQVWFDSTLCQSIPPNMDVDLEHWGDSDLNNWLSEPRFNGKRLYFFGELELDISWFKRQFKKQIAGVGDKFDPSLHTETNVDTEIHALLGDNAFVHQITEWIKELERELPDLKEAIDDLKGPIPNEIKWDEGEKSKVIKAAESLQDSLLNINIQLKQARDLLVEKDLSEVRFIDWRSALDQLHKIHDTYRKVARESGISQIEYVGKKEYEEQYLRNGRGIIHSPDSLSARLLDKFFPSVIWQLGLLNESDLHILGDAGIGKTHIACNICDDRLKDGLPALFVRGSLFTAKEPINAQLRNILDIPHAHSWHNFLQALSAAAEAYNTRIPLIIDGLNESVHNGTFSNIWELGLKGLVQEIAETKSIVLITTCRESYEEAIWKEVSAREDIILGKIIWKDKDSLNLVYAYGFHDDEVHKEAINKYFNAYKIKADDITLAPLRQFEHPLHLKIFCETKNHERKTDVQVYVGEQTLFEVFDEYLEQCNESVCARLGLRHGTPIIQPILNNITKHLWENRSRDIPLEELVSMIDRQSLAELDWLSSKTHAIEDEGMLFVYRDWHEDNEVMSFTYDLFGGYLIAKYLVEQAADDVQGFLNSEETVALLFGENHQILHPMHEDIVRCLAALLPSTTGQFIHELLDNKKAFGLSIRALFEISPNNINEECIDLITSLFGEPKNRESFFKLAETTLGHPNHPFNASFWSKLLLDLSISERDLSWTEYVRYNRYSFERILEGFEKACQNTQNVSDYGKKRLLLLAEHIMWILTSTVRPLRDLATSALFWYGRRFPNEFFDLVLKSFTINDPYVSERLLAATYGIAMARQNDFEDTSFVDEMLPKFARQLYENMFKPNAPHATTHILARDYARRTIELAMIHQLDLLTNNEMLRIKPPYTDGGIRDWGENENVEEGPPPVQMDFRDYTLKTLIKSDDSAPVEYKRVKANIHWRIYDLGFSMDTFGEIDRWLAQENSRKFGRSGDGRKTDRYGKKYSWIAFFELSGYRQDKDLLPDLYAGSRRLDADIDPSFPDEHREYDLVTEDFLGDRETSTEHWALKTQHPDLTPYLMVDQFWEEQTYWVLLDGTLGQEDKPASRKMSAWMQGLIVKSKDVDEILEILNRQEIIDGNSIPFIPEDYRTYAGEIPWCDTYPPNNWQEFSFLVRKYTLPKKQIEILPDGEPIPLLDEIKLRNNIRNLIEKNDEKRLKELLRERNLEITIKTVDEERLEHKDFEVLVPVRYNVWEESNSAANPRRSITVPAREISDFLNLYKKPQSFDFFEKDGDKRASISFRYGDVWSNTQSFTYLRRDLLERFLAKIDGKLIWIIWGNRLQLSENYDGAYKTFQEVKAYHDIQKASGGLLMH